MGNITSYFKSPSVPAFEVFSGSGIRLSKHIQKIGPSKAQSFLYDLLKGEPTARAKFILLSDGKPLIGKSVLTLTAADIDNLYAECESAICIRESDDVLLGALVDAMVTNSKEPGGRSIAQSVSDLVWMAWTMNHGLSCFIGSHPHSRPPQYLQEKFVNAIQDLDDFARRTGYSYQIGNEGFLNQVCIRETMYRRIQHIVHYADKSRQPYHFAGSEFSNDIFCDENEDSEEEGGEEGDDEEKGSGCGAFGDGDY